MQLVGISPDPAPALASLSSELGDRFRLISDEDEQAVTALCGGLSHCDVILDGEGLIRWTGGSESWSGAPPAADLLQAAWRLAHPR